MIKIKKILFAVAIFVGFSWQNSSFAKNNRVITTSGAITETVFALGGADLIVGVDSTSSFPKEAKSLKQVGYKRALSAEGILSLRPNLIIADSESGPKAVFDKIRKSNVEILTLKTPRSYEEVVENIKIIAKKINKTKKAQEIIAKMEQKRQKLDKVKSKFSKKPKVVFVMTHGGNALMVAGKKTAADSILSLSGAKNLIDDYYGYKILNAESLINVNPQIILTTSQTIRQIGGKNKLLQNKAISLTDAGENSRIIEMDSLFLLGFGPRTIDAALELSQQY